MTSIISKSQIVKFDEACHEYSIEGIHIPSVSELLRPVVADFDCPAKYLERGTAVHKLTELYDADLYFSELAGDDIAPYIIAYSQFLDEHQVEVIQTEQMVFNRELLYAGRLDRLWMIDGNLHLTDIKTGSKYKQHLFQLVAYAMAIGAGDIALSNLYLNPFSEKLETWDIKDFAYGIDMVKALSLIYWDNHRKDRKALDKVLREIS